MIGGDMSIVSFESGRAIPDKLTRKTHAHYLAYARKILHLYAAGVGKMRKELHREVEAVFLGEPDCDTRRVRSFCKLLDDAAEFQTDPRGAAAALRLKVFSIAARHHPLVTTADGMFDRTEAEIKQLISTELQQDWPAIDRALYADVIDRQRLIAFTGFTEEAALLARYNVAQLQACLFRATKLSIIATGDFAAIVRRAKLCGLLLDIHRLSDESTYKIDLSGPAAVLRETRRYGLNFARFVPTLLACRDWKLEAALTTPWGRPSKLLLGSEDGFHSHLPAPAEFDSEVERQFSKDWGDAPREGWHLHRDAGILHDHQHTFVPDFVFRHETGVEVFLEIVGFWTPEYLAAKRVTLQRFRDRKILIAVAGRSVKKDAPVPEGVVVYKTKLRVDAVMAGLLGFSFVNE